MTPPATIPSMDANALASEIMRRDRTRMRVLAALTIALWIIAGLMIPAIFMPFAAQLVKVLDALKTVQPPQSLTAAQLLAELDPMLRGTLKVTLIGFFFAIFAAVCASITSIALALTIRRATLRQVSANLAEISAQLRQLKATT